MSISSKTKLLTEFGTFDVCYHKNNTGHCISFSMGDLTNGVPFVRIHSSCLFSEAFHSIDCDCNLQLSNSMKLISEKHKGVIIYLYQEGRGHGLDKKIKALEIMRIKKVDTVKAFNILGFSLDPRNYKSAINALGDLNISKTINLITNNPRKEIQVSKAGFNIKKLIQLDFSINHICKKYLISKRDKLGHKIKFKK
ncbi:MAG: GTP cyclohydrolase II RibA [Patescibacteria group bacterium]|nr:GTP cyclohydrolase II RibA [Patescibacteria group bacterium]